MQYELFDDFKDGMVLTAIPLSWFKRVTAFIKGFGGGGVVKVRTENGAPNVTMDVSISQKADINTEMKPYKDEEGERVIDSPFDGDGENTVSWGINEDNANDMNGCIVTLPTRITHPMATSGGTTTEDKSKIRIFFRSFAKSPSGITAAITKEIGYKDIPSTESKPTISATKGVSVHGEYPALADFYDYHDKAAHPTDPAIVFPNWQARLDLTGDHVPPDRMTGADNTTPVGWERGKTAWKNGIDVDESHPPVGCSMTVCTHMRQVSISGEGKYQAIFSRMEFDENGLLIRVVPCSNWFTLM